MKEKDLDTCLDNLIIKGLIQEAEQDNAEFEVAIREMSDEDFLALIYETTEQIYETTEYPNASIMSVGKESYTKEEVSMAAPPSPKLHKSYNLSFDVVEDDLLDEWEAPAKLYKSKNPGFGNNYWKVWCAAIASVAAILLVVFVPAHMDMNSRLCESALLASETFMSPSRGIGIYSMRTMHEDELKSMLPELERQYSISIEKSQVRLRDQICEKDYAYYSKNDSPRETGIQLVQAYLKLGMKDKAVKILHELETKDYDPEFREYCREILKILE
ncbi:MAG: hypothetical protein K2H49_04560 [Muribaculaceae bacterium]|nr:hypothetical protein [Muribaculaceae bacterium]